MNKLGLHVIYGTSLDLGRPRLVKLVNVSVEYVAEVRAKVGPNCLIIIRYEFDEPGIDDNPEQAARDWYARRRGDMLAMKAAGGPNIAFESACNEKPTDLLPKYVRFSLVLLPLMHADGLRVVWGNCSIGEWREDAWPQAAPVLRMLRPGDYLGVHEYWVDTAGLENRWHVARWTQPQIAAVIGNTPIVVTECGRDIILENGVWRGARGWKQTCDAATFLGDLRRYNQILEQFPQVLGATVFTVGGWWGDYDPSEVWPQVVAGYSNPQTYPGVSVPAQPPAPEPPKEEPMPEPTPATDPAIIRRRFTPESFAEYVADLQIVEPYHKVVIHHTYIPNLARWNEFGSEYWVGNATTMGRLERTYRGYGWDRFPHVFVAPDGIWVLGSLALDGAGVADRNRGLRHIEIVGDYSNALPEGAALDNAVAAAAILLQRIGAGVEALDYHRNLQMSTSCPGDALVSAWGWFRGLVAARLQPQGLPEHETATDAPTLAEKARWWLEEEQREREAGHTERANEIRLSLIKLLYRLETALKVA